MTATGLRLFIEQLDRLGELHRVSRPVSLVHELTEIHRRVIGQAGPALLFDNVIGRDGKPAAMPVLVNLFGTKRRVALGLGVEPHEISGIGETLAFLRQPSAPGNLRGALRHLPAARALWPWAPAASGGHQFSKDDGRRARSTWQTCRSSGVGPASRRRSLPGRW